MNQEKELFCAHCRASSRKVTLTSFSSVGRETPWLCNRCFQRRVKESLQKLKAGDRPVAPTDHIEGGKQ